MLLHRTTGERIFDVVLYALLAVAALTTVYPFIYLLIISLNETSDALKGGLYLFPASLRSKITLMFSRTASLPGRQLIPSFVR